jgi:hypothetical protein
MSLHLTTIPANKPWNTPTLLWPSPTSITHWLSPSYQGLNIKNTETPPTNPYNGISTTIYLASLHAHWPTANCSVTPDQLSNIYSTTHTSLPKCFRILFTHPTLGPHPHHNTRDAYYTTNSHLHSDY